MEVTLRIDNFGDDVLPASIGAHPAFNWPLSPELAKDEYTLTFSDDEIAPIRRLKEGLMRATPEPTPIHGKTLALSERLFDDDAVILDVLASSSVRYAGSRGPSIEMSWEGFRELGIWSKPQRRAFLCINRGAVSRVLRTSTANSPTSRAIHPPAQRGTSVSHTRQLRL